MDTNFSTSTNKTIMTQNWNRLAIGNSGLSLELPFKLDKQPLTLPESTLIMIDTYESFWHVSDKGFT